VECCLRFFEAHYFHAVSLEIGNDVSNTTSEINSRAWVELSKHALTDLLVGSPPKKMLRKELLGVILGVAIFMLAGAHMGVVGQDILDSKENVSSPVLAQAFYEISGRDLPDISD
jgi:hypothetical protein